MDKESKVIPGQSTDSQTESKESNIMVPTGDLRVDDLRAGIARAREQAALTIDEIERRLSLGRIKDQFKDTAHKILTLGKVNIMGNQTGETSKRWASTVVETIKEHPLPSIMIGSGLAWLIASSISGGESESTSDFYDRRKTEGVDETGTYGMGFIERRKSAITSFKEGASQRGEKLKTGIKERALRAKEKSYHLSEQVRQKTSQTASQVKEGLSDLGSSAAEYGQRMRDRVSQGGQDVGSGFVSAMRNHPLALAGILMAAGAIVGLIIPESRYEDRKFGPAKDRMLDQAREKGHETLRKAESVAREAVESAKDEADKQGLMQKESAERAEESVKSVAGDVRARAEKAVEQWEEESEKF